MQAAEPRDGPVVTIDRKGTYRVDCYVRGTVPAPTRGRISAVTSRLRRLEAADVVAECRVQQWPPERHIVDASEGAEPPRRTLVAAFERWADEHGHSLEPAFRRRELPAWPLDHEDGETGERVRVPVVALALSETEVEAESKTTTADGTASEPAVDSKAEAKPGPTPTLNPAALEGVVPYTERARAGDGRTYTVSDWLDAVEAEWQEAITRVADVEGDHDPDRQSVLGGR